MTKHVEITPEDYEAVQNAEFERAFQEILDDAALDMSDVQVGAVMNAMFEMLHDRGEFLDKHIDAFETCRKTREQYPSAAETDAWAEIVDTKARNRLRGLRDDGIEFEDERVQDALDVGAKLLKLYDEYVARILGYIQETILAEDAVKLLGSQQDGAGRK
jgi:hypothetical protein